MSDEACFLIILALLYLVECAIIVRRGTVLFSSTFAGKWRVTFPDGLPHFGKRLLYLCNPFPPLGTCIASSPLPFVISPGGIARISPDADPADGPSVILFDDIRTVSRDEANLRINGNTFAACSSSIVAAWAADTLKKIIAQPAKNRNKIILGVIASLFDAALAKCFYEAYAKHTVALRHASNSLFMLLLVILPAVTILGLLPRLWGWLLISLLALMILTMTLFLSAHAKIFPDRKKEKWAAFLPMLFSPLLAVRASDFLGKQLMRELHPAAVAKALLPDVEFKRVTYRIIRELAYPRTTAVTPEGSSIFGWYNARLLDALLDRFGDGVALADAIAPPDRDEPAMTGYCPRCHCQYTRAGGACTDCGIDLFPY